MTPLHAAAKRGRSEMVGYLAKGGAAINTKNKYGVGTCMCEEYC